MPARKGSGRKKYTVERKGIDLEEIEKLAALPGCTEDEIAAHFGMCWNTFNARKKEHPEIQAVIDSGRLRGRLLIRNAQKKCALGDPEKGIPPNPTMLIWWGKNYLGQSDAMRLDVKPVEPDFNLSALSDEELREFYRLRQKVTGKLEAPQSQQSAAGQIIDMVKVQ